MSTNTIDWRNWVGNFTYTKQMGILNFLIGANYSHRVTLNATDARVALALIKEGDTHDKDNYPHMWVVVDKSKRIRDELRQLGFDFYNDFVVATEEDSVTLKHNINN